MISWLSEKRDEVSSFPFWRLHVFSSWLSIFVVLGTEREQMIRSGSQDAVQVVFVQNRHAPL